MTKKQRDTSDDVGIDEQGRPFVMGDEAGRQQSRIIEHPDAKPVLIVAALGNDIGVRVFGPPSLETADVLDQVARDYRAAVEAARRRGPAH